MMVLLSRHRAVGVFLAFALAYFLSALIRAITATLSPTLTQDFTLNARDLGLLAGGYFLGFAAMQLPLGRWLDRHGPKTVILCFLAVAVAGCLAFSLADSFAGLLLARILCGVGFSACLMAALTGYRRWFGAATQLRSNSWMLMTGSMGMVASTLPVQWLMPLVGWRAIFWGMSVALVIAMGVLAWQVPSWSRGGSPAEARSEQQGYAQIWRHPYFRRMTPIGFFNYGGMVAIQTLWVVPWWIRVAGYTPVQASTGLFWLNVSMLLTFWSWGLLTPWLARRGLHADRLIAWGTPLSLLMLAVVTCAAQVWPSGAAVGIGLFCVSSTFISLAQPAVGLAFPPALAGRALSAYNLVVFAGIFVVQWGIGLLVDGLQGLGWSSVSAFQGAMAVLLLACVASYVYFLTARSHNQTCIVS